MTQVDGALVEGPREVLDDWLRLGLSNGFASSLLELTLDFSSSELVVPDVLVKGDPAVLKDEKAFEVTAGKLKKNRGA